MFVEENAFGNVVCEIAAILSRPQFVKANPADLKADMFSYLLDTKLGCYVGIYLPGYKNTQIILWWAHKQFATPGHTLLIYFDIFVLWDVNKTWHILPPLLTSHRVCICHLLILISDLIFVVVTPYFSDIGWIQKYILNQTTLLRVLVRSHTTLQYFKFNTMNHNLTLLQSTSSESCPQFTPCRVLLYHCNDVIMSAMASQITSLTSVYPTVYAGADQRQHQSSASLAFVWGIHRWAVNSPHKGPVTQEIFPFDDVIMFISLADYSLTLNSLPHVAVSFKYNIRTYVADNVFRLMPTENI